MELVDVYDRLKRRTGYTRDRYDKVKNMRMLSVHLWIINKDNQILAQLRSKEKRKNANKWANTGGAVDAGEESLDAIKREAYEELGIKIDEKNLTYIASYIRKNDFADVYLLTVDTGIINEVKFLDNEVSKVEWLSIEEFQKRIEEGSAVKSSFDYFMMYMKSKY